MHYAYMQIRWQGNRNTWKGTCGFLLKDIRSGGNEANNTAAVQVHAQLYEVVETHFESLLI